MARSNQETEPGKNASPCLTQKAPYKGLCADSGEKHEPASDDATVVVNSLKALDPNRPIREADSERAELMSAFGVKRTLRGRASISANDPKRVLEHEP